MDIHNAYGGNLPAEFITEVAKGNVPGHSTFNLIARKESINNSFSDVWGFSGDLVHPTAGEQWEVVSDDSNDNASGTGARLLLLDYLDFDLEPQTEVISLNGLTVVPTVATNMYRLQNTIVISAGATEYNEGSIIVRVAGGGANRGCVPFIGGDIGFSLSQDSHYTVPKGKTVIALNILPFFPKGFNGSIRLRVRRTTGVTYLGNEFVFFESTVNINVRAPGILTEGTDIWAQAKVTSGNSPVFFTGEFLQIDNNLLNTTG